MALVVEQANVLIGFPDHVAAEREFLPVCHLAALMPHLLLEQHGGAVGRLDKGLQLLHEAGLTTDEAAVQIDQQREQRDAAWPRLAPVVHSGEKRWPGPQR